MNAITHNFNAKKPELGGRLYDGKVFIDYDRCTCRWAVVVPGSPIDQWHWGWKQEPHGGRWYREVKPGQNIWEQPTPEGPPPAEPKSPQSFTNQIILRERGR